MKSAIFFLLLIFINTSAHSQNSSEVCYNPNLVKDTTKKSINSMVFHLVDSDSIKISYHSPGVRKRIVWGGLVPFDEVWVTGAHDATYILMPKSFEVGGKTIPSGKYAFFTIPGENEWTLIINKNWKQHLASEYDEKEDILRVKVKPKKVEHTERLQYFIEMVNKNDGKISMAWEKVKIELPFRFL
ncbi:MAG: hypothetical protein RL273_1135 [Bacteroidota bacterium]|jgi:hypothetical protein